MNGAEPSAQTNEFMPIMSRIIRLQVCTTIPTCTCTCQVCTYCILEHQIMSLLSNEVLMATTQDYMYILIEIQAMLASIQYHKYM